MQTARVTTAPTHTPRRSATIIRLPTPATPVQDEGSDLSRFVMPVLLATVLTACCLGWEAWVSDDTPHFAAAQHQSLACASLAPAASPVCVAIR